MEPQTESSVRPRLRVDLRTLLIWMLYLAIGMALGSAPPPEIDPDLAAMEVEPPNFTLFNALLGAASAAIAVGLVQQGRTIGRQTADWPRELALLRTGARWEAALRWGLAAVLVGCMTTQLLTMRQFFTFPEDDLFFYNDVVTQYLWWLGILIVLNDAFRRSTGSKPRHGNWLINNSIWLCLLGLAIYVVTDQLFVTYLVHLACRGVDSAAPLTYQRYPVITHSEQWHLFLYTAGGAAMVVIAGVLLLRVMTKQGLSALRRPSSLAAIVLLLGGCGGVCYWFYAVTRHQLAPDLENIGFGASWWQQAGGIALAALLSTYAVYRGWRAIVASSTTHFEPNTSIDLPLAGENLFALVMLSAAATLRMGQIIWANLNVDFLAPSLDGFAYLLYLVVDPLTYFIMAMLLMSLQLIRLRWKGRAPGPLVVVPLKSIDFIVAWLLLAATVAIAIPTFAAFGFSYWLGPWYRW